ncbi:MAG: DUF1990 domain-containing protein [Acidimicrobiales bacterium]
MSWIRVGRPSASQLERALAAVAGKQPTYDHYGSTLDPAAWPGRVQHHRSVELGHGDAVFVAACDSLRAWACHRGIRARVFPDGAPLAVGTDVLVMLPVGPFSITVPNRIVAVVDEPGRFGFAYGTLPGHQERGEEAFVVDVDAAGTVTATIRVDAVTATFAAGAIAPVVRRVQHVALERYLAAWRSDALARPS